MYKQLLGRDAASNKLCPVSRFSARLCDIPFAFGGDAEGL